MDGELAAISLAMAARGPDASGAWRSEDGRMAFAHRRLSIIDLAERADQPMVDGADLTIVFNGEIYNFKELRADLIANGDSFNTASDTEVLLKLFRRHGIGMLRMLRGMFALAIYDSKTGCLTLARDPYGIKPLYYADDGKIFRFASTVRAMRQGQISSEVSDAAVAGFLMLGSVPEPHTILRDVRALPAGHVLQILPGKAPKLACWYDLATELAAGNADQGPLHPDEILEALKDSARAHMTADTPVGLFLSAGIDSTLLLALLNDMGFADTQTLTAGFAEFAGKAEDESILAAKTANHYGSQHWSRTIGAAEFDTDLRQFFDAMDQPTIDGLNCWFIAKIARERGLKVCLSGLGGDELFGGYPSFADVPKWSRSLGLLGNGNWRRSIAGMGAGLFPPSLLHPKIFAMLGLVDGVAGAWQARRGLFMPWDLGVLMGRERARAALAELDITDHIQSREGVRDQSDFGRVLLLESSLYMRNQLLRDADWAGMAHSVEIRVPFVDKMLFEKLAPRLAAHHSPGKTHLAELPGLGFPPWLADRKKTGFVTPIAKWSADASADKLLDKNVRAMAGGHWSRRWALSVLKAAEIMPEPENMV